MARLITIHLIETEKREGNGTMENPLRIITQFFWPDGTLVLEYDAHLERTSMVINLLEKLSAIPKEESK